LRISRCIMAFHSAIFATVTADKCHQIPSNTEDDGVRLAGHPEFESKVFLRNTDAGLLRKALLAGRIAPRTAGIACVVNPDRSSALRFGVTLSSLGTQAVLLRQSIMNLVLFNDDATYLAQLRAPHRAHTYCGLR
jgi:hypothetical protein